MIELKKASLIYLLVCSVLAGALFANASGASNILAAIDNIVSGKQEAITAPQALICWVSDTIAGPAVTSVRASYSTEYTYWCNYWHHGIINYDLSFMVLFQGIGWGQSVLVYQLQTLHFPGGYGGANTYSDVPFAVIDWGGNVVRGPAYLIPIVDGVIEWSNYYAFTVTG